MSQHNVGGIMQGRIATLGTNQAPAINLPNDLKLESQPLTGDSEMNDDNGMANDTDVFNRLAARKARRLMTGASPRDVMQQQKSREYGPEWHMVHDKHEAHRSPVYAMTSVGN